MSSITEALKGARLLAEKYPDSPAGKALKSFIEAAPEKINDPQALREELANWLLFADLPDCRQLRMCFDVQKNAMPEPVVPEGFILEKLSKIEDYHSHNTRRLDVEGMKELLLKLRFIREDLGLQPRSKAREIRSE